MCQLRETVDISLSRTAPTLTKNRLVRLHCADCVRQSRASEAVEDSAMTIATAPTERHDDDGALARYTAGLVPYAPSILRVVVGLIFLVYGWNKVQNPAGFEQMLTGLGFPAAAALSWLVIALEVAGGAALIIGLLVRPIALLFAPEAATGIELDLALLAASVVLLILGPGRLSIDRDVLPRELV